MSTTCRWPACPCKATGIKCKEYIDPKKKKTAKVAKQRKVTKETDYEFYMEIWNSNLHFCSNPTCKTFLGHEFRSYFMDHILEKGSSLYKHLRHEIHNICILCIQCHTNKGNIPYLIDLRAKTITRFGMD